MGASHRSFESETRVNAWPLSDLTSEFRSSLSGEKETCVISRGFIITQFIDGESRNSVSSWYHINAYEQRT